MKGKLSQKIVMIYVIQFFGTGLESNGIKWVSLAVATGFSTYFERWMH